MWSGRLGGLFALVDAFVIYFVERVDTGVVIVVVVDKVHENHLRNSHLYAPRIHM